MFYQLPPVGNPICFANKTAAPSLAEYFSPYKVRYYASGTEALAAAIISAKHLKDVDSPEVILPAYACPDLVSAAIYAETRPVLVDLEEDRPWMNLAKLSERVSSSTVAIIATDLFGISERLAEIRSIAEQAGAVLIEDSAQAFPGRGEPNFWEGDLVVISFGRGKPVSLLGGGAILSRRAEFVELLPQVDGLDGSMVSERLIFRVKAQLYNKMISPWMYWLPQSMPFLRLGETRYDPLTVVAPMGQVRLGLLPANILAYQKQSMQVQHAIADMFEVIDTSAIGLVDLVRACSVARERRLLRYPLLVDAVVRDQLYHKLRRKGLGASVMYPSALPAVSGLETLLHDQGAFPVAEAFAARLLTLPTHAGVGQRDIAKMQRLFDGG
jgi:dTDP-4-amino-4,6-dideoxygalactose transaminase